MANSKKSTAPQEAEEMQLSEEQKKIIQRLQRVKFRKKIVGGVDEMDVWKKIEELNSMYEEALLAERVRCETLIAQCRQECEKKLGQYTKTSTDEMPQENTRRRSDSQRAGW